MKKIISKLIDLGFHPESVIYLEKGRSNESYLFTSDLKKYVFRTTPINLSITNYAEEYYNLKAIFSLGITGETIYFDEANGDKITEYIESDSFNYSLEEVSALLHKLHDSSIKAKEEYNIVELLNKREMFLKKIDPDYYLLKQYIVANFHLPNRLVFSHGDFHRNNLVYNKGKLFLLDFEFSKQNSYLFDIATYGVGNMQLSIQLLEKYLKRLPTEEEIKELYLNRLYQVTFWYLIACLKDEKKFKNNIDFRKIAEKMLADGKNILEYLEK